MKLVVVAVATLLPPAISPAISQAQSPSQMQSSSATASELEPGDVLRITVWRRPELSGDFVVAPDSTITHPLYRDVKVVGIPLANVEERVRVLLTRYETTPTFVISPLLRVFVGGEVHGPSVYMVAPGTTVGQAIGLAGGPTDRGQMNDVLLVRGQQRQTLDLTSSNSRTVMFQIRSGDQLLVARQENFLTDVLGPASSIIAAAAALVSIVVLLRR